jgi:hypothetical protein
MNNSEIIRRTQQQAKRRFKAEQKKKAKSGKQIMQSNLDKTLDMESYKIASVLYERQQKYKNNLDYYRKNSKF